MGWPAIVHTDNRAKIAHVRTISLSQARDQNRVEDSHHAAAVRRGKAAVENLQKRGILDNKGRRIRTDLPADMQEAKDRNFGG